MPMLPRRLLLAAAVLLMAGCTTVYVPRYADRGVYHEAPSTYYDYDPAWAANPVHYPYWSLDYFYFSNYYHPYSVVVGSWDPYYYPYPGWWYGPRDRYRGSFGVSISFGDPWWGYPWHGHGYRWRPAHYGYFGTSGYGHGHRYGYGYDRHYDRRYDTRYDHRYPVHNGNDRLRALQRRESVATRSVLRARSDGRYVRSNLRSEHAPIRTVRQSMKGPDAANDRARSSRATRLQGRVESRASNTPTRSSLQSRPRMSAPRQATPSSRSSATRIERRRENPPSAAPSRAPTRVAPRLERRSDSRFNARPASAAKPAVTPRSQRRFESRSESRSEPRFESRVESRRSSGDRPAAPRAAVRIPSPQRDAAPAVRSRAAPAARIEPRSRAVAPPRPRVETPPPRVRQAPTRAQAAPASTPRAAPAPSPRAAPRPPSRVEPRSDSGRDRLRGRRGSGRNSDGR